MNNIRLLGLFGVFVVLCVALSVFLVINDVDTAQAAIDDDLVACWDFDEESGTRYDSVSDNDLTENNTVGYVSGVIGNAAKILSANSESMYRDDNDALSLDNRNWTLSFWVYIDTDGSSYYLGKYGPIAYLYINTDYQIYYGVTAQTVSVAGSIDAWHLITTTYDQDVLTLYVDTTSSTLDFETAITADSGALYFGKRRSSDSTTHDVYFDVTAKWDRVLTSDEIAELYNSGSGRDCDYIVAGGATPTPTQTPTPTSTPVVDLDTVYTYTLSSGNTAAIDRTVTYGDMIVFSVLGIALVIGGVMGGAMLIRRFL